MIPTEHSSGPHTLLDYIAVVRRRKSLVIVMALAVPIAALLTSLRQPDLFSSTAAVLLSRQNLGSALTGTQNPDFLGDPARFAQTQADIARVREVAERALERSEVRGRSVQGLLDNSTVIPASNADLLRFTVRDGDPAVAPRLATAYAEAFTSYRSELDTATLRNAREELEATLATLRRSGNQGTEVYRDLVAKAQDLRTMELLQIRNTVVQPAISSNQVQPTPIRNAALGLMLGVVLGLIAAFLWEALDRRVRSEDEIERRLGLSLLARLPEPPRELRAARRAAILTDVAGTQYFEAVRRLRTNLEFANIDAKARVIAVTSALEGEGKTTTISNLAVALARAGHRTALVDLDLRQPYVARLFGLEGRPGVTDVAIEHVRLSDALVPLRLTSTGTLLDGGNGQTSPGMLYVLPSGDPPTSPGEFIGSQAIARLVEELRKTVEYVLVDAPPLLVVGDTMTLSTFVDALLVVVRTPVAHRTTLADLARELDASPATKLGFVLTGADERDGYGYGYGYGYTPRGKAAPTREPAEVEVLPQASRRA